MFVCWIVFIVIGITAKAEYDSDSTEFVDFGVRLVGISKDELMADLIAEERDLDNHGEVRRRRSL